MATKTLKIKSADPKVAEALQPLYDKFKERIAESLRLKVANIANKLKEHGGNFTAAFPRPSGNDSRAGYATKKRENSQAMVWTVKDEEATSALCKEMGRLSYSYGAPEVRTVISGEELDGRIDNFASMQAKGMVESYALKMTAKVAEHRPGKEIEKVGYFGSNDPWSDSDLVITFTDGETITLTTKVILNVSPLGTLFNQFPTRLV